MSVQGLSSSVPPRPTSDAPAALPSTPPSTDDIDTDWGADDSSATAPDWAADDSNEVTRVMQQPMRVQFTHSAVGSEPPTSPTASVAPPPEPATSPTASVRPPEAKAQPEGSVRPMRPRAATLIGLPAPKPPAELTQEPDLDTEDARDSTPPPMPSAAFSEPVRAPSVPPPPHASPSAAPPPIAPPSAPPPPIVAPSASSPVAAPPSAPPPPIAAPSAASASRSSAPPARSSVAAPRVLSATPEVATPAADGNPSGFGRWLLVLAAGLVVVGVLGYRVINRNRAALAEAEAANSLAEPAATATATATAEGTPPAALEAASAEPTSAGSVAAPAPAASSGSASASASAASAAAPDPAPTPAASASAAPSTAADGDIRKVTVKSRPSKVRFFHFGKQVGVTPFVLELKPGERHAYEAGLPGYNTRKVVIDGSKPQIMVGLTREKP